MIAEPHLGPGDNSHQRSGRLSRTRRSAVSTHRLVCPDMHISVVMMLRQNGPFKLLAWQVKSALNWLQATKKPPSCFL